MKKKNNEISEEMKQYYLDRIKSETPNESTGEVRKRVIERKELMKKMSIEELKRQGREDLIKLL